MAQVDESLHNIEEVVVTGTFIRGADLVGSESLNLSSEDIVGTGKSTLGDFFRELPSNFAGGVGIADEVQSGQDQGASQANLSGGQGINLRGLGSLSTLVLVNGRRVAASGQYGDFVDISNIPMAAIERVEVVQDGASALYGSDAVGGVVNFITKRDIDAPETTLKVGQATQGGGEETTFSHVFGKSGSKGNFVAGFEYYHRDNVAATDRDPYSSGNDFSSLGGVNWQRYATHVGTSANIFYGDSGGSPASAVAAYPTTGSNTNLTNSDLNVSADGTGNTYNPYEALDLLPEIERKSYFATFDFNVTEAVSLYGDIRYSERESNYDLGYSIAVESSLPTSNPYYIDDIDSSYTNSADASIPFAYVADDRADTRVSSVDSLGLQLGTLIELGGSWSLDLSSSYSLEEQSRRQEQLANVSLTGSTNAFECALQASAADPDACGTEFEAFNPWSSDPMSETQLSQLYGYENLSFDSEVVQVSATANGEVFQLPAGALAVAFGVDYRVETMSGAVTYNTGSVTPISGDYTETERDASSVFAEVSIPVLANVDLSLAGRYESFSGTGDYETFNPKVGINWHITDGLKLRASWGTSFHAPPMRFENDDPQPLPGGNAAYTLPATYFGPCDSDLVSFNGISGTPGVAGQDCSFTILVNSGGAGEGVLEPETAETFSFGFDWQSMSTGFDASINYFDIAIDDRIQRIQGGTFPAIVAEFFATGTSPYITALNVGPDDADVQSVMDSGKYLGTFGPPLADSASDVQMIVNATQINIATLETSGIDLSLGYNLPIKGGDLRFFLDATRLLKYETEVAPGAGKVDQLGTYSSFGAPVEWRSRQGVSARFGDLSATLAVNYVSSYECAIGSCMVPDEETGAPVSNTSPVGIDAWLTTDLNVNWVLDRFGGVAEGTTLSFNANNVFDEDPPFIDGGTNATDYLPTAYDPNNHTIVGRVVSLSLSKKW